ncbi:MAG: SET domain-containing protein-lysine N-methyltransferase [Promethearchaeota archaeon]
MNKLVKIEIISEKKGRGLIANQFIKKGTLVEKAPILLLPNSDWEKVQDTIIYDYCFTWDDPKNKGEYMNALALSIMQMMNHSYTPNMRYEYDYEKNIINFIAIKDIEKGTELTVNYNGAEDDKSPVWFEMEE